MLLGATAAVGSGNDFKHVAARVLEVGAAPAVPGVDLARLKQAMIGPVVELARLVEHHADKGPEGYRWGQTEELCKEGGGIPLVARKDDGVVELDGHLWASL